MFYWYLGLGVVEPIECNEHASPSLRDFLSTLNSEKKESKTDKEQTCQFPVETKSLVQKIA